MITIKIVKLLIFSLMFLTLNSYAVTSDQYEPNNVISQAKRINLGEVQSHTMFPRKDDDWLKFTITKYENIELLVSSTSPYKPTIYLYNNNQTRIESSGFHDYLRYSALAPGTYFVWLEHSSVARELEYNIELKVTSVNGDIYETNNIFSDAKRINFGEVQRHTMIPMKDDDWLKFTVTNNNTDIELLISTTSSNIPHMFLYNSTKNKLKGSGFHNYLRYSSLQRGTYYVWVEHSSVSGELNYNIELKNKSPGFQPVTFSIIPILNLLLD